MTPTDSVSNSSGRSSSTHSADTLSPSSHTNAGTFLPFESMTAEEKSQSTSPTSSYHPLNASLIVVWAVLIAAEIILLERSVALAPTSTSLPWYYSVTGLPAVLNVVFAQGHGLVTAMFLSPTPRTWLEMFWIANQNWSGPLGILTTMFKMVKLPFSLVSIVALITPIVLDQAYPIRALDVQVNVTFTPSVLSPNKLLGIDAYAQLAAGRGVFNSTTFSPTASSDLFFSGDVRGMDVMQLPGIRVQGGCHNFTHINASDPSGAGSSTLATTSIAGFDDRAVPSNTSLLAWFTNSTADRMLTSGIRGVVRCDAYTTMGNASDDGLYDSSHAQGGEPIQEPLFGALYALLDSGGSDVSGGQVIDMLGFTEVMLDDQLAGAVWSAMLSRNDSTTYAGIDHVVVSGPMALLAVWLLSLVGMKVAFSLRAMTDLVEGDCSGSLEDNRRLLEKFVVS
ncbi:hypothetical protein BC629DRAFT_1524319 [Irpex lacteus]|nr:hypothetical protein BC629DRAFT_1524319 [Irpex lacteus]